MVKIIKLEPIKQEVVVKTNTPLLSGLLQQDLKIMQVCGHRGLCATCHVYIKDGMESLSPMTRREQRTLGIIETCRNNSRLACQTHVLGEGVTVELPSGMYVSDIHNTQELVGRRAQKDILHPLTGKVLVEESKLITRSMISLLDETRISTEQYLKNSEQVV